jgi:hypothetical protein
VRKDRCSVQPPEEKALQGQHRLFFLTRVQPPTCSAKERRSSRICRISGRGAVTEMECAAGVYRASTVTVLFFFFRQMGRPPLPMQQNVNRERWKTRGRMMNAAKFDLLFAMGKLQRSKQANDWSGLRSNQNSPPDVIVKQWLVS